MPHSVSSRNVRAARNGFATDVEYYLTLDPRQLPSKYLYDALGSALFNAICELPWYRITRAEISLLAQHGRAIFAHAARAGKLSRIVELGPGNGTKMLTLLNASHGPAQAGHYGSEQVTEAGHYGSEQVTEAGHYGSEQVTEAGHSRPAHLALHLIDVSTKALDETSHALAMLDDVDVVTHEATYESGLTELPRAAGQTLVLFLGSNIGNFDRPGAEAFLRAIRAALAAGDQLLLGADLVKPEADLLLAYDDPLGVTAAFNRNLLVRINRELGGNFDLSAFSHRAVWNRGESRVEMHLVCERPQQVRIPAARVEIAFRAAEAIWTESSYKYEPDELDELLESAGFRPIDRWMATEERFALTLAGAD